LQIPVLRRLEEIAKEEFEQAKAARDTCLVAIGLAKSVNTGPDFGSRDWSGVASSDKLVAC
jgi:hypothetical protein